MKILRFLLITLTLGMSFPAINAMKTIYSFPQLTGQYVVGTQIFDWVDTSRIDPKTGEPRELVVQAWYPTAGIPTEPIASYAYESLEMFKRGFLKNYSSCSGDHIKEFDLIRTHAIPDAPPLVLLEKEDLRTRIKQYPVVIFGHGYGMNRGAYSIFCENIASHGYVVLMVMHTYVNELARFQDGREITLEEEDMYPRNAQLIQICFEDIQFMLNQVIAGFIEVQKSRIEFENSNEICYALGEQIYNCNDRAMADALNKIRMVCDFSNIGIIGHSLGGIMASQCCRRDDRFKVGISLDGPLFGPDATKLFNKPFMLMYAPSHYNMFGDDEDVIKAMNGSTIQEWIDGSEEFFRMNGLDTFKICIDDSEHNTFSDNVVMADIFRKIFNDTTIELDEGKVNQAGVEEIRKNIISFLNQHLKHSEIYSQS